MTLIPRRLAPIIKKQQSRFPVIAITGPRQSGKTTLLRELFKEYRYISLENPNTRSFASEDPVGFLDQYDQKVIIDEAQRVPKIFSYIQSKVDENRKMGQFILSGSQNFHLLAGITQSLAGRVALFKLLPLDIGELKAAKLLSETSLSAALAGSYPAIYDREIEPGIFYSNYVQTYIEKDVTELLQVRNMKLFRTFIGLCAGRAGQLLNYSALANECDIAVNTAKTWLSLLESSYIIFTLQPYHENFNKRLVKTPKLYFYDTGLLCYLLRIRSVDDLSDNRLKGQIFENMIVAEYHKMNHHLHMQKDFHYWQDSQGHEIDLFVKGFRSYDLFEIKATQTISSNLFKEMDRFETLVSPDRVAKTLIYGGAEDEKRTKYTVLSWKNISD